MTNSTAFDLRTLIESEIPEGRQSLEASYANLERVAAYCEANYLQATDKQAALEETRRYTVQSLASVAYQVNTLASNLLQMLELQTDKIAGMESQVTNIAQIVDIHKEKVARREIGVLTANKSLPRQHKIITPVVQEKHQRYIRRQIDYSILDELGHGVKLQASGHATMNRLAVHRTGSTVSGGSSNSGSEPVSYQGHHYGGGPRIGGSVSKAVTSRDYRAPLTTSPPNASQTDNSYRYSGFTGQLSQGPTSQQQTVQHRTTAPPGSYSAVNIGGPQRISQIDAYGAGLMPPSPGVPPPMQPISTETYRLNSSGINQGNGGLMVDSGDGLPPPPSPNAFDLSYSAQYSPPLPPPPMDESVELGRAMNDVDMPDLPQYGVYVGRGNRNSVPDWVPGNYLEKVVAIYDYQAEKPDELSFAENSVIYVLKKNEDGWFEGVMDGMTGLFPGNYVDSCM